MRQINLRVPEELLVRVDRARGDVPRERWLRRVVERALAAVPDATVEQALDSAGSESAPPAISSPAPAEQSLSRVELFRRATQR